MKKSSIFMFVLLIFTTLSLQTASAQFPINIPKIPKTPNVKSDGYDKQAFIDIAYKNRDYIDPYLECYAKKHNLELIKVTGNGFHERYFYGNDVKKTLQEEQTKLGEIEAQLKSKLKSRPDTGSYYMENPAIWEEITVNRAQYLQCAVGAGEVKRVKENPWLQRHLAEIAKRQKEVEDSAPGNWLLQDYSDHFLLKAVSPSARNKWLTDSNAMDFKQYVDPPLDSLAATAAKKLPSYLPDTKKYSIHNPAEEKLMKGRIDDIANVKIFYIGLETANWLIDKNDLGIPIAKYKHGIVWLRRTTNDHPYCTAYYINILQDYAGGGTYGASYGNFIDYDLVGCPAGK